MPPPPPPHPPAPPPHHLLKKPTSLPDVIFTAISLLVLFSTSPKPNPLFFLPNANNLSFQLNLRKFPKMSTNPPNPRNPRRLPPAFATPQSLSDWLKPRLSADLFGSWGVKPGTKNVHNLWLEIADGETSLADSMPPVRTVEVVIVRIIRNDGKILIESHQELSNGAVRHRCRPLSEKMKPGESIEAAVYRAVKEELGSLVNTENFCNNFAGIHEIVKILPGSYVKKIEEGVSVSYPGLPACYVLHTVDAEVAGLPENEFCTEEIDEYGDLNERGVADSALCCKKHYWKWVDSDSI
ncbi:hypothetical protein CDL12_29119 [Handroanthus impetiginosus]|uniref:Uncharacterized protein n=1 Tax=Handroanthus impetiginosus TaxID=429701 RepID=A0A2G9FZA3_9LAMI|nr:hypothetical protein CDL12_29119 [Handroanthus impetiginosus]